MTSGQVDFSITVSLRISTSKSISSIESDIADVRSASKTIRAVSGDGSASNARVTSGDSAKISIIAVRRLEGCEHATSGGVAIVMSAEIAILANNRSEFTLASGSVACSSAALVLVAWFGRRFALSIVGIAQVEIATIGRGRASNRTTSALRNWSIDTSSARIARISSARIVVIAIGGSAANRGDTSSLLANGANHRSAGTSATRVARVNSAAIGVSAVDGVVDTTSSVHITSTHSAESALIASSGAGAAVGPTAETSAPDTAGKTSKVKARGGEKRAQNARKRIEVGHREDGLNSRNNTGNVVEFSGVVVSYSDSEHGHIVGGALGIGDGIGKISSVIIPIGNHDSNPLDSSSVESSAAVIEVVHRKIDTTTNARTTSTSGQTVDVVDDGRFACGKVKNVASASAKQFNSNSNFVGGNVKSVGKVNSELFHQIPLSGDRDGTRLIQNEDHVDHYMALFLRAVPSSDGKWIARWDCCVIGEFDDPSVSSGSVSANGVSIHPDSRAIGFSAASAAADISSSSIACLRVENGKRRVISLSTTLARA